MKIPLTRTLSFVLPIGLILGSFLSCDKSEEFYSSSIEGDYSGVFERNGISSKVELYLHGQKFTGESEEWKYPAICQGEYSITGRTINFQNSCIWTAETDGTLILHGEWNYSFKAKTLVLTNYLGDRYILKENF